MILVKMINLIIFLDVMIMIINYDWVENLTNLWNRFPFKTQLSDELIATYFAF